MRSTPPLSTWMPLSEPWPDAAIALAMSIVATASGFTPLPVKVIFTRSAALFFPTGHWAVPTDSVPATLMPAVSSSSVPPIDAGTPSAPSLRMVILPSASLVFEV